MRNQEEFLEKSHQNKVYRIGKYYYNKGLAKKEIENDINIILEKSKQQQKEIKDLENDIELCLKLKEQEKRQIEEKKKKEKMFIKRLQRNYENLQNKVMLFLNKSLKI